MKKEMTYEENFGSLLEGWIGKKTLNMMWHNRYFVLTPSRLMYYLTADKSELKGCFNLVSLTSFGVHIRTEEPEIEYKLF